MAASKLILVSCLAPLVAMAQPAPQAPGSAPISGAQETPKGIANPAAKVTGVDEVPLVDPASETVFWDGRVWSVTDQRALQARWFRFLNEPEDESARYKEYSEILKEIIDALSADKYDQNAQAASSRAYVLLQQAAEYPADAGLCQTIANQVAAAWRSERNGAALAGANAALEKER